MPLEPVGVSGAEDPNLAALLAEVRSLGDRIERLAVVPRSAPSSERKPASVEGSGSAESTAELLERCTTLLERLERRSVAAPGAASLVVPSQPPSTAGDVLASFVDATDEQTKVINKQHLLWDYQQVLDSYGKPDRVASEEYGRTRWFYFWGEGNDRHNVDFAFMDGMVINMSAR